MVACGCCSQSKLLSYYSFYFMRKLVDTEQMYKLLQTRRTVIEKEGAEVLADIKGCVNSENVFFSYNLRNSLLQGLNISAAPGEIIDVVGVTGACKLAIFQLLLCF